MKYCSFLLILLVSAFLTLSAQGQPCTGVTYSTNCDKSIESPIVADTVFPYGQFDDYFVGPLNDGEPDYCRFLQTFSDLGFNFIYNYESGMGDALIKQFFAANHGDGSPVARKGILSAEPILSEKWVGHYNNGGSIGPTEFKYFLASNWTGDAAYDTRWNWATRPSTNSTHPDQLGQEVYFKKSVDVISPSGNLLEDLQTDPSSVNGYGDVGNPNGYTTSLQVAGGTNTATTNVVICDFVFRLYEPDYPSMSTDDQPAYRVDYVATFADGHSSTVAQSNITPEYYWQYVNQKNLPPSTASSFVWGANSYPRSAADFINTEQNCIRYFPLWNNVDRGAYDPTQWKKYALVRAVIDLGQGQGFKNDALNQLASPDNFHHIVHIECKVVPISPNGIFIRGLRFRSQMGDDLLRGKLSSQLRSDFQTIQRSFQGYTSPADHSNMNRDASSDTWSRLPGIQGCNECTLQTWPALAYIDQQFKKFSRGKRIYPFIVDNFVFSQFDKWRAVYEDVTGELPPSLIPECDRTNGTAPLAANGTTNGSPRFETQGYPKDLIPKNISDVSDFTLFGFPIQGYDVYTKRWIPHLDNCLMMSGEGENAFADPGHGRRVGTWIGGIWEIFSFKKWHTPVKDYGTVNATTGQVASSSLRGKLMDLIVNGNTCWTDLLTKNSFSLNDLMNDDQWKSPSAPVTVTIPESTAPGGEFTTANQFVPRGSFAVTNEFRQVTGTEIRAMGWGTLAEGAKGIVWNTFLAQNGEEIGVLGGGAAHHYDWWFDNLGCDDIAHQFGGPNIYARNLFWLGSQPTDGKGTIPEAMYERWAIQKKNNGQLVQGPVYIERDATTHKFPSLNNTLLAATVHDIDGNTGSQSKTLEDWMSFLFDYQADPITKGSHTDCYSNYKLTADGVVAAYVTTHDNLFPSNKIDDGSAGSWEIVLAASPDEPRWKATFTSIASCGSNDDIYWPKSRYSHDFMALPKTYLGASDKYDGVKRFSDDIRPVMKYFKGFERINTVLLNNMLDDDVLSMQQGFPIDHDNVVSRKVNNHKDNNPTTYTYTFPHTLQQDGIAGKPATDSYDKNALANPEMGYAIGAFRSSDRKDASEIVDSTKYIVVANKRSWPVYYEGTGTSKTVQDFRPLSKVDVTTGTSITPLPEDQLLGPVDTRLFSFRLNPTALSSGDLTNGFDFNYYNVADLRTGRNKLIKFGERYLGVVTSPFIDTFAVLLDPGEGTLMRISPAYGYVLGKASEFGMAYNNGHRVAEIVQANEDHTPPRRIVVWENKGKILYKLTNQPIETGEENFFRDDDQHPSSQVTFDLNHIDGNANPTMDEGHNPSVATRGDHIAVTWSTYYYNTSLQLFQEDVYAVEGQKGTDWDHINWSIIKKINTTPLLYQAGHIPAPSITATSDGWLCAYSNPNQGIVAKVVRFSVTPNILTFTNGTNPPSVIFAEDQPRRLLSVFPSVASIDESDLIPSSPERLHLVWEEQLNDGTSQIYYRSLLYTAGISGHIDLDNTAGNSSIERVSKLAPSCVHHHPNVAVSKDCKTLDGHQREPIVTWEMTKHECNAATQQYVDNVYVMLRERLQGGGWTSFTSFYPKAGNLPLPLVHSTTTRTGAAFCDIDINSPNAPLGNGFHSLVFQDTFVERIHIMRDKYDHVKGVGQNEGWLHTRLLDHGRYPNVVMPYQRTTEEQATTFTYRGIDADPDNLYAVDITARKSGIEQAEKTSTVQSFNVLQKNAKCEDGLIYTIGDGGAGCDWCTFIPPDTTDYPSDPPYGHKGIATVGWAMYDIVHSNQHVYDSYDSTVVRWPTTEDSVRTNYFHVDSTTRLFMDRTLVTTDSTALDSLFDSPDTSRYVDIELVLKDSATHAMVQSIERVHITPLNTTAIATNSSAPCNGMVVNMLPPPPPPIPPPGPGRHINMQLLTPPSGAGYLTLIIKKDSVTSAALVQRQGVGTHFDASGYIPQLPDSSTSFKRIEPKGSNTVSRTDSIVISVNPNPFHRKTTVHIQVPKNVPMQVTLYDALGRMVRTYFEGVTERSAYDIDVLGESMATGRYYLRVQTTNYVKTGVLLLNK
ncbi:MAG: T9SS type A sorting domain-containing protein [Bacteroidetes bacterium]|nr:T9SS type A sorting domain-containing protein [Bacteroidota bacterium]